MKRKRILLVVGLLLALTVPGRIYQSRMNAKVVADEWLTDVPGPTFETTTLPDSKIYDVLELQLPRACDQLSNVSIRQVNRSDAEILAGRHLTLGKKEKVYLVRGLDPFRGTGRWRVDTKGHYIWVENIAGPSSLSGPLHKPILVCLKSEPTIVFVSFSRVY